MKLMVTAVTKAMKLLITLACLFVATCALGQKSNVDQRVTLKLENITLEEALTVLAISYGVPFSYSDDLVPLQSKVSLDVEEESLKDVLKTLLDPMSLEYKFVRNRIVIRYPSSALVQTVRGIVLDQDTQMPLPGASIQIADTQLGAIADEHGRFRLENVPIGRITLQAGSIGYMSRQYPYFLLGTGKELVVDIRLEEAITTMNAVVVTSGGSFSTRVKHDDAVTSSHSFSPEETQRFAGNLADPARTAASVAGVTSASDENNSLIVRGNSPRGVLWRVEGIEVPNPNHFTSEGSSSGVISILSPNIIGSTNFLTGAFPANFGNALSAVFDVSLREGNNEKREHSLQVGTLGLEASTEGPLLRKTGGAYLFNYRYSTLSLLDKAGFELNDATHYKNYQDFSFHISLPSERSSLNVFGIGGESVSDKNQDNVQDMNGSSVGIAGITYKYRFNDNLKIATTLSWSGTDIDRVHEVSGLEAGPIRLEEGYRKSYVRGSIAIDNRVSEKISLVSGVIGSSLNYDFQMLNQDPTNATYNTIVNFAEKDKTMTWQAYTRAKHQLTKNISAFYGFHFLHFNLSKDVSFEPRASIWWKRNERSSFALAYGRHSRIENLQYYLARDHQAGGNEVQINKDLAFTRAHHVVGTYHRKWTNEPALTTEIYYQRLENVPVQASPSALYASINEDTGFITDTLVNEGNGENYGWEISLERGLENHFYYVVNGSLFQSRLEIGDQPWRNTAYNGNYSLHLLAGKEFLVGKRRQRLSINVKYTNAGGRRYVPIDLQRSRSAETQVYNWQAAFDPKLPHYWRMDFQIGYRLNKPTWEIEWKIDVQNILDHRNAAYYYYDVKTESIKLKRQIGVLPLITCKVTF
jgi:hypothetical protein